MSAFEELEFSSLIDLDAIGKNGAERTLCANNDELARIAQRLGVARVEKLEADLRLNTSARKIHVRGALRGAVERTCVASLETFTEMIDAPIDVEFQRRENDVAAPDDEEDIETPEIHIGAEFDLGEFAVHELSLAMAPFPRKPGALSLVEEFGKEMETSALAEALKAIKNTDGSS